MVALEGQVRVGERELRNDQLERLGHLRGTADAKLADGLLHLGIISVGRAKLKRVRLPDQHDVLDAHRGLASVIQAGSQLGARIVDIGTGHAGRQRGSWLRGKWIAAFLSVFF